MRREVRPFAAAGAVIALAVLCRLGVRCIENDAAAQTLNFIRFFLYLGLFVMWGYSVRRRVMQTQLRLLLVVSAALMALWLTLRELRWHLVAGALWQRLLWYGYYVPILAIPLLVLFVSLLLGKGERERLPRAAALLVLPTAALAALVLTNDLHQLVFRFPPGAAETELGYRYGPVFALICVWAAACASAALGIMIGKSRVPQARRLWWLPLLPIGADLLYTALYVTRFAPLYPLFDDVTVVNCLAFAGFLECCIRCGLIPTNLRYFELFCASEGISAEITDEAYRVCYASAAAEPVAIEEMRRAESGAVLLADGRRLHSRPVDGGHMVWTEDVSALLRLQESLRDRREELRERNALLQLEYEREKEHRTVAEQNRLYDLLQSRTQTQLERIETLAGLCSAAEPAERRRYLAEIVVLGSYIKRRRDLILSAQPNGTLTPERLASALEESVHAMRLLPIEGACLVRAGESALPAAPLSLAYEFFEDVLEQAMNSARHLSVTVCRVGGALRCAVRTDGLFAPDALREKYPRLQSDSEEGDTLFLLPLEGGDGA